MAEKTILDKTDSWSAADGMYAGVDFILNYIQQRVTPSLEMLVGRKTGREQYMIGLFHLAHAWMKTLKKLNHPGDIQALMTCARGMVEITVDLTHLYRDRSRNTVRKMLQYDRLQKFKQAKALVEYYHAQTPVRSVPDQHAEVETWLNKNREKADRKKRQLWPGNRNIQRWSGNNLLQDIQQADRLLEHAIKEEMGVSLEEFYETEYRKLHWYVHGSGLSGFWNLPAETFNLACSFAFWWSCNLAMICIQIILAEFNITKIVDLDDEWTRLKAARQVTFLELNPKLHDEVTPELLKAAKVQLRMAPVPEEVPAEEANA